MLISATNKGLNWIICWKSVMPCQVTHAWRDSLKYAKSQRKSACPHKNDLPSEIDGESVWVRDWQTEEMECPLLAALASHLLVIQPEIFDRIWSWEKCKLMFSGVFNQISSLCPAGLKRLKPRFHFDFNVFRSNTLWLNNYFAWKGQIIKTLTLRIFKTSAISHPTWRKGADRGRTRGRERGVGKSRGREGETGSMLNMTSKYLIASVAMSASQTGLVFSHIHQPWVSEPAPVSSCPLSVLSFSQKHI